MNKKIIIPIIILLIFGIIVGAIYLKSKSNKTLDGKLIANEVEEETVFSQAAAEEDTVLKSKPSSILIFDKNGGLLKLYNSSGNLVDELDLKMLDIGVNLQSKDLKESEMADKDNEVLEEKHVIVKTLVGDESVDVEIKGDRVIIYDEDGEKVEEFSLKSLLEKGEDFAQGEKEVEAKEEATIKSSYNLANNKLLATPVDTTFTNFRTIKDELVFRDDKRDSLILVDVEEDKIVANLVLKGVKLQGLNSVFLTNESIFLTFNNDKRITRIPRHAGLSGVVNKNDIVKYEIDNVPNFVYAENGIIYYSAGNVIGKYDMTLNEVNHITEIDTGDKTLDMYVEKDFVYAINEFGKGNENSVLIKINKKDLSVDGIMELKGIYSKFIGVEGDVGYIRQKDSVKKVDLKNMKPLSAFARKEGVPILVSENIVYTLEDNVLERANIGKTIEKIDSFNAEGFNFIIR